MEAEDWFSIHLDRFVTDQLPGRVAHPDSKGVPLRSHLNDSFIFFSGSNLYPFSTTKLTFPTKFLNYS